LESRLNRPSTATCWPVNGRSRVDNEVTRCPSM
jgi:hypothetical protein